MATFNSFPLHLRPNVILGLLCNPRYPYEIGGPVEGVLTTQSLRDCRSSSAGFASASEHNP